MDTVVLIFGAFTVAAVVFALSRLGGRIAELERRQHTTDIALGKMATLHDKLNLYR